MAMIKHLSYIKYKFDKLLSGKLGNYDVKRSSVGICHADKRDKRGDTGQILINKMHCTLMISAVSDMLVFTAMLGGLHVV